MGSRRGVRGAGCRPRAFLVKVRLSLAVAAARVDPDELERFLECLPAAELGPNDEVEIAGTGATVALASTLRDLATQHDRVRLTLHPLCSTPMQLWGFAMARARGEHVGVLDVRAIPVARWVTSWSRAPRDHIVCGPVNPGFLVDPTSWAAYLSEYGHFLAPLELEGLDELPGNNIVFPRGLLPSSETLERKGFWKTFHIECLRRRGEDLPIAVESGMCVIQEHRHRLAPYLQRRYLHGRCYGGRRLQQPGAPNRLLCLGFTPVIPWLRIIRVLRRVRAKKTGTGWRARAFGVIALGEIAWSVGEFLGYARGEGDACSRLQ